MWAYLAMKNYYEDNIEIYFSKKKIAKSDGQ